MKIFISYRRDDSAGYAGRLFDHLAARFGARNVFMDIDTIQPGEDFRKAIEDAVGTCEVVLVMIGRQWVNATDPQGQRRLDDPGDFVRAEIAGALANPQVRVIPVLVRDATMPGIHELPEDIKELSWRNAIELSDHRFQYDANKLIEVIERAGVKPARTSSGKAQNASRARYWGIILGLLALGFAIWMLGSGVFPPTVFKASPPTAETSVPASTGVEANELTLIRTIPPSGDVVTAALSSDGKMLALAVGYDGMIKILSTSEDTLLRRLNAGTTVLSLAFSQDNQMLAAGLVSSSVKIFRVSDGVELHTLEGLSSGVYSLAFSPNGQALAAGAEPDILLWQVSDGAFLQKEKIEGIPSRVISLAFSPDGGILAAGLYYSSLKLWQVADGTLVYELPGGSFGVLAFSPDGETLASAGQGSTLDLWRMRDGEKIQELKGHTQVVDSIAFSSDSQTLISVSKDVEVRRWQVSDGTRLYTRTLDGQNIRLTLLSRDSRMLMAAYSDGTVKLWQVP
ncbi:MAG TPA: TIR domain-containing protein [Anaerolineales bacterium]|nr:TIR domain-containing protein [Anaerolineales bacterium]